MDKLKYYCGDVSFSDECDFLIKYDKRWNEGNRNHCWYILFALPRINGGEFVRELGRIWIGFPKSINNSTPCIIAQSSNDVLTRTMGPNSPFESIPSFFQTLISEKIAKQLFILLTPAQRVYFINSLNVIVSEEDFSRGRQQKSLPTGLIKQFDKWEQRERIDPIRKYLYSEINYRDLPSFPKLTPMK